MVEGLNHLSYQQRLRGLVLFRLEKRMLKGRKSSMCIYVRRRETKNEEARMFIIEASDRTRSNEHILKTKPIKQQQKETKQNTKTNTLPHPHPPKKPHKTKSKIPSKHKKSLFYCENGLWELAQVAQRGCEVSIHTDMQNEAWGCTWSWKTCSSWPGSKVEGD